MPNETTATWRLLWITAWSIRPFFLRLKVEGIEHVPPTGGGIIACNHTMGPDFVILGYASPRQIYFMAKAEIYRIHPWIARLMEGIGAIPVHRGQGDSDAVVQAVRVAQSGKLVGMFPEGTRSRTGALQRGKTGVARIALQAQMPIVPAVVINAEAVLPNWLKFRRRPLVTMRFGPPIPPEGSIASPRDVQRLTTTMMLGLAALLPEERRGHYARVEAVRQQDTALQVQ